MHASVIITHLVKILIFDNFFLFQEPKIGGLHSSTMFYTPIIF